MGLTLKSRVACKTFMKTEPILKFYAFKVGEQKIVS